MLFLSLAITILAFALLWALHLPLRNAGVVDFYWGPGFAVIGLFYFIASDGWSSTQLVFLALIFLWAIRLSFYLFSRFMKHPTEDHRYAAMRKIGGETFWWTSLFKIFTLQAVIMWIIASPLHVGLLVVSPENISAALIIVGVGLFVIGFTIESVADFQLTRFKAKNPNSDALLTSGLWSWSRHPNYFGEAVLWWGLGIFAFAMSGSLWAFFGPAILTIVMIGVSSVITDKHMAHSRKQKYAAYFRATSRFVPIPPGLRS